LGFPEVFYRAGADAGPHDSGEESEHAIEVESIGPDHPLTQQVQPKVHIGRVHGRLVEVFDGSSNDPAMDPPYLINAFQRRET
jgi:hypothetical protein